MPQNLMSDEEFEHLAASAAAEIPPEAPDEDIDALIAREYEANDHLLDQIQSKGVPKEQIEPIRELNKAVSAAHKLDWIDRDPETKSELKRNDLSFLRALGEIIKRAALHIERFGLRAFNAVFAPVAAIGIMSLKGDIKAEQKELKRYTKRYEALHAKCTARAQARLQKVNNRRIRHGQRPLEKTPNNLIYTGKEMEQMNVLENKVEKRKQWIAEYEEKIAGLEQARDSTKHTIEKITRYLSRDNGERSERGAREQLEYPERRDKDTMQLSERSEPMHEIKDTEHKRERSMPVTEGKDNSKEPAGKEQKDQNRETAAPMERFATKAFFLAKDHLAPGESVKVKINGVPYKYRMDEENKLKVSAFDKEAERYRYVGKKEIIDSFQKDRDPEGVLRSMQEQLERKQERSSRYVEYAADLNSAAISENESASPVIHNNDNEKIHDIRSDEPTAPFKEAKKQEEKSLFDMTPEERVEKAAGEIAAQMANKSFVLVKNNLEKGSSLEVEIGGTPYRYEKGEDGKLQVSLYNFETNAYERAKMQDVTASFSAESHSGAVIKNIKSQLGVEDAPQRENDERVRA